MYKTLLFYFYLLRTSMKASVSLRWNFLFEMLLMLFNNLIFFSIWWVFFTHFNDIGGWHFRDMAALMAIGTGAYGLRQVCFGGAKSLARSIVSGGLDPFITRTQKFTHSYHRISLNAQGMGTYLHGFDAYIFNRID